MTMKYIFKGPSTVPGMLSAHHVSVTRDFSPMASVAPKTTPQQIPAHKNLVLPSCREVVWSSEVFHWVPHLIANSLLIFPVLKCQCSRLMQQREDWGLETWTRGIRNLTHHLSFALFCFISIGKIKQKHYVAWDCPNSPSFSLL